MGATEGGRGCPERGPGPEAQREKQEEEDRAEGEQVEGREAVAGKGGLSCRPCPSGGALTATRMWRLLAWGLAHTVSQGSGQTAWASTLHCPAARTGFWMGRRTGRSTDGLQGGREAQAHRASSGEAPPRPSLLDPFRTREMKRGGRELSGEAPGPAPQFQPWLLLWAAGPRGDGVGLCCSGLVSRPGSTSPGPGSLGGH